MTGKEIRAKIKDMGIVGEWRKTKRQVEIRVTDSRSLTTISQNIQEIKSQGFYIRMFGQCHSSNMNPETPNEMARCDSCYLSHVTYG